MSLLSLCSRIICIVLCCYHDDDISHNIYDCIIAHPIILLFPLLGGSDTDSTTNDNLAPSSASTTKPAPTAAKVTNIPPLKQLKEELRAATKKRKELAGELEAKNNKISYLLPAAKSALLNRQEGNDGKWVTNYLELKRKCITIIQCSLIYAYTSSRLYPFSLSLPPHTHTPFVTITYTQHVLRDL